MAPCGSIRARWPVSRIASIRLGIIAGRRSPRARAAEVKLDRPSLHWSGSGYLDSNWGDEPLENTPFYTRSVLATHLLGKPVTTMH